MLNGVEITEEMQVVERFISPSHPVYVVAKSTQVPHIQLLQDELKKQEIVLCMQTSTRKLAKIPGTPEDKFFVVVDDSDGKIELGTDFKGPNMLVYEYPNKHSLQQILASFDSVIGLGKMVVESVAPTTGPNASFNISPKKNQRISVMKGANLLAAFSQNKMIASANLVGVQKAEQSQEHDKVIESFESQCSQTFSHSEPRIKLKSIKKHLLHED